MGESNGVTAPVVVVPGVDIDVEVSRPVPPPVVVASSVVVAVAIAIAIAVVAKVVASGGDDDVGTDVAEDAQEAACTAEVVGPVPVGPVVRPVVEEAAPALGSGASLVGHRQVVVPVRVEGVLAGVAALLHVAPGGSGKVGPVSFLFLEFKCLVFNRILSIKAHSRCAVSVEPAAVILDLHRGALAPAVDVARGGLGVDVVVCRRQKTEGEDRQELHGFDLREGMAFL